MMKIDIVIPVYRPTQKLKKMLYRLTMQTVRPEQIILVHTEDGYDLSGTIEVCSDIPVQEIMIAKKDFDHGRSRDLAMRKASAEVVVMMTQDAIPTDRFLLQHLRDALMKDSNVAISFARQLAEKESNIIECYTRLFNYPEKSTVKSKSDLNHLGIKTYFCSNVCAAYKRDVYLEMGGFEKEIIFNEDMIFAANVIQNGYKVAYAAEAKVIHSHNYTYMKQLRRNFDQGVSQTDYPHVFGEIKAETEGIRLVKQTALYLLMQKQPLQIMNMVILSACKYLGFKLGRNYRKLPKCMIRKLTMNPNYWRRKEERNEQQKEKNYK